VRSVSVSLVVALSAAGCVSSPPRLPPRRTTFVQSPAAPPAPDLTRPTEPPIVHERYGGWIFLGDLLSVVPLTVWMARPNDAYLAAPALLLAPGIHVTYGESDKGAISVILRSAMIAGVYFAGRSFRRDCAEDLCYPFGALVLAELAIIPVVTIDAIFLARRARPESAWHRLPAMQPAITTGEGGRKGLSLIGRF
jgi:hypothetical protein